jgi:Protein of unknown function (DUF1553)/Protein of unknown function (DUF1549)/Planctomycete cytochrome C
MNGKITRRSSLVLSALLCCQVGASAAEPAGVIDYNRKIRPILSNNCFRCHGPDAAERESGLRLDRRDDALAPAESGKRAIVPGKPESSRLVARILSSDPAEIMPPPETNKKLSAEEKELLRQWVAQGALYQEHWSFVVPKRLEPPAVSDARWARNPIDRFILAYLEAEKLRPAPEADRGTLLRRVTLDLTGLPPTLQELDAFLADKSPQAYETVVDRLLSSPHYGERMALDWLDASRFADTHGYHIDSGRDMTRWREWVIDAFQNNKPFDRFTIEQLAGDLLPNPTRDQLIASGFNRNHMINFEGGAIPEEYHTAYIVDRVNTTATVWLGLTIGCAQCHDHKYDPLSQRDFYGLFAYFHNVPENGLDGSKGNAAPMIKAPSPAQESEMARLETSIARLERKLTEPDDALDRAQTAWEEDVQSVERLGWTTIHQSKTGPATVVSAGGATVAPLDDDSFLFSGDNPAADTYTVTFDIGSPEIAAFRLEVLPDDSLPARGAGRSSNGNFVLTDVKVFAAPAPDAKPELQPLKSASADYSQKDYPVAHAIDGDPKTGWAIFPETGKPHTAVFQLEQPIRNKSAPARITLKLACESQFGQHQPGRIRVSFTRSESPHGTTGLPEPVRLALASKPEARTPAQKLELQKYFRTQVASATRESAAELARLRAEQNRLDTLVPTAMVMREMEQPRDTFLLIRGQYDKKGEKVTAAVPAALAPLPEGAPANRLGLARWLVARSNPLTARVTVNRYWQMFLGTGLVKTVEDFGSQGEPPSHPELLDWLAERFTTGTSDGANSIGAWDVRALVRSIVTSATYRQSSVVSRALYERDPENRLLARGPRFRLQAEFIRDQALAAGGLLNRAIGGKSVSPYQPAGLWEELMSREDGKNWTAQSYEQSHGADLYRRTMYTFWKRTCPPPTLSTFDAPDRETCTVRRARTNTPLQALVLLNDPTYVEAARKFAERILKEGGTTSAARLEFAFRTATSRRPAERERAVLARMLDTQLKKYAADPVAASKLLKVGESPHDETLDPAELAAWAAVAGAILNLDEVVTRG